MAYGNQSRHSLVLHSVRCSLWLLDDLAVTHTLILSRAQHTLCLRHHMIAIDPRLPSGQNPHPADSVRCWHCRLNQRHTWKHKRHSESLTDTDKDSSGCCSSSHDNHARGPSSPEDFSQALHGLCGDSAPRSDTAAVTQQPRVVQIQTFSTCGLLDMRGCWSRNMSRVPLHAPLPAPDAQPAV